MKSWIVLAVATGLTTAQSDQLDKIPKCAVRVAPFPPKSWSLHVAHEKHAS